LADMAPTVAEGPMASSTMVQGTVEHTITADQGPTGETEVTGRAGEEGVGMVVSLRTAALHPRWMAYWFREYRKDEVLLRQLNPRQ